MTDASTTPPRIVIVGLPASGKSSVARQVAGLLGWRCLDSDETIVASEGCTIPEIFRSRGEAVFRRIEHETLARLAVEDRAVIATGGGSILAPENRRLLWQNAFVIQLRARPEVLLARVCGEDGAGDSRPLLTGDHLGRLRSLTAERAPLYDLADWSIETDGLSTQEVAEEVVRAFRLVATRLIARPGRLDADEAAEATSVDTEVAAVVRATAGDYPIVVGWDILATLGQRLRALGIAGRVSVVTDEHVAALHAETVLTALARADYEADLFSIEPGEEHKSLEAAQPLFDWLISRRAERREAIVALGGGVVTDLAGFVAATYLRGVPLVHVPTSLLGAVDAAIGGKVAVDHRLGKNLIGAFYQPRLVLIDALLLKTLPQRELTSGWAEVIKHGLIADRELVDYLERNAEAVRALEPDALLPVLRRSVQIKAEVVSADERESGLRSTLNYGHTIGHALEAATAYQGPLHGEAVSVGMVAAGEIGRRLGLISDGEFERQNRLLEAYGLPLVWPEADGEAVLAATAFDKKIAAATIRWVLLDGIGRTVSRSDVSPGLVAEIVRGVLRGQQAASEVFDRGV